jgi:hypothetical protein
MGSAALRTEPQWLGLRWFLSRSRQTPADPRRIVPQSVQAARVADILPSAVKMIAAPAVSSGEIDQLPANAGRAGHPRAAMVAYVDDFKMTMLFVLGSIPLLPMRDPRDRTPPAAAVTPRRPAIRPPSGPPGDMPAASWPNPRTVNPSFPNLIRLARQVEVREDAVYVRRHDLARWADV